MKISFHYAEKRFPIKFIKKRRNWIISSVCEEGYYFDNIDFILCSDEFVLNINRQFLNHDFYTDVITFYDESDLVRSVEIYVSVERVRENSITYKCSFDSEFNRVLIHSLLHLMGYDDKSSRKKSIMTNREDYYLEKF